MNRCAKVFWILVTNSVFISWCYFSYYVQRSINVCAMLVKDIKGVISYLGQRFKICRLKIFLFLAVVVICNRL